MPAPKQKVGEKKEVGGARSGGSGEKKLKGGGGSTIPSLGSPPRSHTGVG